MKITDKSEIKEIIYLFKQFLNLYNLTYEMSIIDAADYFIKNKELNIFDNNGQKIGDISYFNNNFLLNLNFENSTLRAKEIEVVKKRKRLTLIINYDEKENNSPRSIKGKFRINKNGKDCEERLRGKNTIKHSISFLENSKEINYFRIFTIKNSFYLCNRQTEEFMDFENISLSHKKDNDYFFITYDDSDKMMYYKKEFKEKDIEEFELNKEIAYAGGFNFENVSSNKKYFLIRHYIRTLTEEIDPRYYEFIEEQRNLLNSFHENYFEKNIISILCTLNKREIEELFEISFDKGISYFKKRNN